MYLMVTITEQGNTGVMVSFGLTKGKLSFVSLNTEYQMGNPKRLMASSGVEEHYLMVQPRKMKAISYSLKKRSPLCGKSRS